MANDWASSVALLIDADNLSPTAVEEAFAHLRGLGLFVSVRRAYGGSEKLSGMREVLKRHGVVATVNQGKGTTDVSLVVDAMDLLHRSALPSIVAIGSSDADFAPLAVRLREAGVRVLCFAQQDKAALEELPRAYEKVVYVDAPRAERAAPVVSPAAPAPAAKRPAAKRTAAKKVAAPKPVAAAPAVPADEALGLRLRELLEQVPGLTDGRHVEFGDVVKQLRDARLLSKSANASRFLKKHAPYIVLTPEKQPNKLHWVAAEL